MAEGKYINNDLMRPYDESLREILENGVNRTNKRTGIKTKSIFGMMSRYRLDAEYFPLLTRRRVWPKSVFAELLWFLSGSTSNKDLQKLGCNFWNPWVDHEFEKKYGYAEDTFGPVYGFQLRYFGGAYGNGIGGMGGSQSDKTPNNVCPNYYGIGGFDQLKWVIERVKEDPSCRRTLWTLWNPQDVHKMRLPPCHMLYQVFVDDDRNLTGLMYQRSADFPIGSVANIFFYSCLTTMIAQQTDCKPKELVYITGDTHIYEDQIPSVKEYLNLPQKKSPIVKINKAGDIFSYNPEDLILSNIEYGPRIDIPVAI